MRCLYVQKRHQKKKKETSVYPDDNQAMVPHYSCRGSFYQHVVDISMYLRYRTAKAQTPMCFLVLRLLFPNAILYFSDELVSVNPLTAVCQRIQIHKRSPSTSHLLTSSIHKAILTVKLTYHWSEKPDLP